MDSTLALEVSGQLHTSTVLPPGAGSPVPIGWEAGPIKQMDPELQKVTGPEFWYYNFSSASH